MIELPEAAVLSSQVTATLQGQRITAVTAARSPHKLAWYHGDPQQYPDLLVGQMIGTAAGRGGLVEIQAGDATLVFSDGVGLRHHAAGMTRPDKHQLLLEFADGSALSAAVQMYGGLICFRNNDYQNPYYQVACAKPSPLSNQFDQAYFSRMVAAPENKGLSSKALLATEQRIPGLGNGVLQDILFLAGIHPKRKVQTLTDADRAQLFRAIKETLTAMASQGGRDTEKDLFGKPGGYVTRLSKNTVGKPCPLCGSRINKEAYLGGSIYYCPGCQK